MRSTSAKTGSGRIVVALLGLLFMKALGDVLVAPSGTRGRQAEAIEPAWDVANPANVGPVGPADEAKDRNTANQ